MTNRNTSLAYEHLSQLEALDEVDGGFHTARAMMHGARLHGAGAIVLDVAHSEHAVRPPVLGFEHLETEWVSPLRANVGFCIRQGDLTAR